MKRIKLSFAIAITILIGAMLTSNLLAVSQLTPQEAQEDSNVHAGGGHETESVSHDS